MNSAFYTDIHTHIIFSVDDGPEKPEGSIGMIEQALDCNIRQVAATPHITDLTDPAIIEKIRKNFEHLQNIIIKRSLPLEIFPAVELIFNDKIYEWMDEEWVTFNGNGKYFLFELPLFDFPKGVGEFIFQIKLKGYEPVLAHPERYMYLQNHMDQLLRWRQQGCLMQMNAGSLTGQFGGEVTSFTKKLLEADFYTFASSDAHDADSRNFKVLPKAYEIANELISAETADNMFKINPDKAIKGLPISQTSVNESALKEGWFSGIINSIKNFKLN